MTGDVTSLGVYVHLPFCRLRCTYCAFAISTDRRREKAYQEALLAEIAASPFCGSAADTVYLGGGTPSLTSHQHLAEVMSAIRDRFAVSDSAEITIEANPEDVSPETVARWCGDLGVNRISLGVQSFNDQELYPLGRGHSATLARSAVAVALQSGARVSLDLILGLPNQMPEPFKSSLRSALDSGVGHLSVYMLDLEPGSALEKRVHSGKVRLPDEEQVAASYLEVIRDANGAGFRQYEISNFARPGEESRHNLKYWTRQPYAGFGLGAHSFDRNQRWANTRELDDYIGRLGRGETPVVFRERLDSVEQTRELIFLGLRQARGLRYSELLAMRGQEASEWVSRGLAEGWLHSEQDRIAFTGSGFLLSNDYISQLF